MKTFTFIYEKPPKTKQRPRHTKHGHTYTPAKTLEAENELAEAYKAAGGPVFDGPVDVSVKYTKGSQQITITQIEGGSKLRGDVDNYLKLTLDALQKCAFADDKQVLSLRGYKR